MSSLRARLLVSLLAAVLLSGLAGGVLAYRNALAEANAFFDEQLRDTALVLRDQPLTAPSASFDMVIQVWSLDGVSMLLARPFDVVPGLAAPGFSTVEAGGALWRVYALRTAVRIIQVAQPLRVRSRRAAVLALRTVWPLLLLMPALGALVWITVARALAPLRELERTVQSRDAQSLAALPERGLPEEIVPLVRALNELLARLGRALERERSFLADAAHELRTPITALSLQLEELAGFDGEAERAAALTDVRASVQRASRLIEQLLALARQEARVVGQPETVALDALAREVVAELVPQADARRLDLGISQSDPALVRGDADALRTLLRNLVDNAIRYSPAGGRVDVAVIGAGKPSASPMLRVIDEGPGIPPAERERVFWRFHRLRSSGSAGSGLGLAIVRSIAEAHRARVELGEGPDGRGLTVSVLFPAA